MVHGKSALLLLLLVIATVAQQDAANSVAQDELDAIKDQEADDAFRDGFDMSGVSCAEAARTKTTYFHSASGITITWDAKAKLFRVDLLKPTYTTGFYMPDKAIEDGSVLNNIAYFLTNKQHAINQRKCRGSLGDAVITISPQPGYHDVFPDGASVIPFVASRFDSNDCGDSVTIWGMPAMSSYAVNRTVLLAALMEKYKTSPDVLHLPEGMTVSVVIKASLITTNATNSMATVPAACVSDFISLGTQTTPANTTRHLLQADKECFGPSALERGAALGKYMLGLIPGMDYVVYGMQAVMDFVEPETTSAKSLYDCISGFVEAAINVAIDRTEKNLINTQVKTTSDLFNAFLLNYKAFSADGTINDQENATLQADFRTIETEMKRSADALGSDLNNKSGIISELVLFLSTLYFPYFRILNDQYTTIFGGTSSSVAVIIQQKLREPADNLARFKTMYTSQTATMLAAQRTLVADIKTTQWCNPSRYSVSCRTTYKFSVDDKLSKQMSTQFENEVKEDETRAREDSAKVRTLLQNIAESTLRIELYQATSSQPSWDILMPNTGKKDLAYSVAVEKRQCFSNWVDCALNGPDTAGPTASHDYSDYNISKIEVKDGAWIDWMRVTYTSKSGKPQIVHEVGNNNDATYRSIDLRNTVVTKARYSVDKSESDASWKMLGFLKAASFQAASGASVNFGVRTDVAYDLTDDFSAWGGKVWLCGIHMHGTTGKRVHGIGAHWCYWKATAV